MGFCANCGSKISEGSRYCTTCGTPINSSTSNVQRIQVYDGIIHKCPNCGNNLDAFVAVCPVCGFELRNVGVTDSIRIFASKIEQIESKRNRQNPSGDITETDQQIISLINSFVVPNTKEDLFEFAVLSSTNIDVNFLDNSIPEYNAQKAICKAWKSKLDQVYQKSIMVFDENDERLGKITRLYNQTQANIQIKENQQKQKFKLGILLSGIGTFTAVTMIFFGIFAYIISNDRSFRDITAKSIIIFGGITLIVAAILSGVKLDSIFVPLIALGGSILMFTLGAIVPVFSSDSQDIAAGGAIMFMSVISLIIALINLIRLLSKKKKR